MEATLKQHERVELLVVPQNQNLRQLHTSERAHLLFLAENKCAMCPIYRHSPPIALIEENSSRGKLPIYPGSIRSPEPLQREVAWQRNAVESKRLSNGRGWFCCFLMKKEKIFDAEFVIFISAALAGR